MKAHAKKTYEFAKKHVLGLVIFGALLLGTISAGITIGRAFLTGTDILLGQFVLFHFAAYIFFIISSAEMFYIKAILSGHPAIIVYGLALLTAITAQAINYLIGFFFSEKNNKIHSRGEKIGKSKEKN